MRPTPFLLAALLVSLAASAPAARAALDCTPANPFPASPVGGEVGRFYGFATGTAHAGVFVAVGFTCSTLAFAFATAEAVCMFLLGTGCPP
ncbi:MAG TPA: hypothetical protein VNX21_07040 [Candidatus Thermoplasmatota archaeon]|nr:hypothetical protein [Candidatus Thermoplasmatota archaeon]